MARGKWHKPGLISKCVAGALATVVLAVTAVYVLKVSRPEKSTSVPENLPKDVNQQLSGYTFTRSEGGRQIFTVRAAHTVAFKNGGKTLLEDVSVEVYGRSAARHDLLRTSECSYQPETGGLSCLGKVEIELNAEQRSASTAGLKSRQPVYLETSKLNYEPREATATSDQPVRFHYGPASGSAVGIRYDTKDGRVELTKDVVINLSPPGSTLPLRIASAGLEYEKETGRVGLRGPVEITQGRRRVLAEQGTIILDPTNRINRVILAGGAEGSDTSRGSLHLKAQTVRADFDTASTELRTLVADGEVRAESRSSGTGVAEGTASVSDLFAERLQVTFTSGATRSAQPLNATASGRVKLSLESRPASSSVTAPPLAKATVAARRTGAPPMLPHGQNSQTIGRTPGERDELTASQVDVDFRPGGQYLREARTIGPGQLVICPSDPKQGRRVITAGQFLMAFDGRNHVERLHGLSPTRVVVESPSDQPSAVPQESRSDELDVRLDPTTQELVALEQTGHFQFRDGDRHAKADRAYYSAADQISTLIGHPLLWDPETRIRANQFRIDLRNGRAEGTDNVESTHFGRANTALEAASPPGTGKKSQRAGTTTNVLADRVVAERDSQLLHYEGHVRAWNGDDVVESPSLDIYRNQQRIVSGSGVVSSHLQLSRPQPSLPTRGGIGAESRESAPVTIRADRLEYSNEGHQARYQGHVEIESGDMTLRADLVDVNFSPLSGPGKPMGPAQIERVVATGHVAMTQPTRRATGEHAEYFAGPGKIVIEGGPPALYDEQNGFTTGQSLTFFIHDDSLLVDGGDESSTLSKRHLKR